MRFPTAGSREAMHGKRITPLGRARELPQRAGSGLSFIEDAAASVLLATARRRAMRVPLLALVSLLASAGCVQMAERQIDQARESSAPQESTRDAPPNPSPSASPSPSPRPAPTPWPHEGSHVRYTMEGSKSFTGSTQGWEWHANASWTYHAGDWHGTCSGTFHDHADGGAPRVTTFARTYEASHPPHWPILDTTAPPPVGGNVTAWTLRECGIVNETHTFVGAQGGAFHASDDAAPDSFSTTWSRATGLVLTWGAIHGGLAPSGEEGRLVDTDAP